MPCSWMSATPGAICPLWDAPAAQRLFASLLPTTNQVTELLNGLEANSFVERGGIAAALQAGAGASAA